MEDKMVIDKAVIEVSAFSQVKTEFLKNGNLSVKRIVPKELAYPFNYGYIPHTLTKDGDGLDVCVFTLINDKVEVIELPIGAEVQVCLVDMLYTYEENKVQDCKVIAVAMPDNIEIRNEHIQEMKSIVLNYYTKIKEQIKPNLKVDGSYGIDSVIAELKSSKELFNQETQKQIRIELQNN